MNVEIVWSPVASSRSRAMVKREEWCGGGAYKRACEIRRWRPRRHERVLCGIGSDRVRWKEMSLRTGGAADTRCFSPSGRLLCSPPGPSGIFAQGRSNRWGRVMVRPLIRLFSDGLLQSYSATSTMSVSSVGKSHGVISARRPCPRTVSHRSIQLRITWSKASIMCAMMIWFQRCRELFVRRSSLQFRCRFPDRLVPDRIKYRQ